jgi:hypothetical protein
MENDNKNPKKSHPKKKTEFYCKKCDYRCCNKKDFRKHKMTAKHLRGKHGNKKPLSVEFMCENCGKSYKHRSGLSRHIKKCIIVNSESVDFEEVEDNNVILLSSKRDNNKTPKNEIAQKDAEINALKIKLLEKELKHKDQIIDILKNSKGNTTTTNNNNTNNFNNCNNKNLTVNLYLNEHCKDAMNLTDFVNQITVQLEDILFQDKTSSAEGLSNIITKQLKNLEPTERPIHCSDAKRLKFYVKDNDKWEKDENNEKLDNTIRDVKLKQTKTMTEWEKQNPTYKQDSKLMDEWMDILDNVSEGPDNPKKAKIALKKKIASCTEIKDAMEKIN